jgi:SIR2-like domain
VHWAPGAEAVVVERPNEYRATRPDERAVILKMHGAVDRTDPDAPWDSYVITEDHYIEYLAHTDLANLVPVTLAAKLRRSHFLFLGYSMRDWNLRVILHRIWGEQKLKYKSWAVQLRPSELDREFWELRGVDVLDVPLDDYIAELDAAFEELLAEPAEP